MNTDVEKKRYDAVLHPHQESIDRSNNRPKLLVRYQILENRLINREKTSLKKRFWRVIKIETEQIHKLKNN